MVIYEYLFVVANRWNNYVFEKKVTINSDVKDDLFLIVKEKLNIWPWTEVKVCNRLTIRKIYIN